jgi:hypothetical protein
MIELVSEHAALLRIAITQAGVSELSQKTDINPIIYQEIIANPNSTVRLAPKLIEHLTTGLEQLGINPPPLVDKQAVYRIREEQAMALYRQFSGE